MHTTAHALGTSNEQRTWPTTAHALGTSHEQRTWPTTTQHAGYLL
jgi:hypothetical protein